jgi:hypothetical protein
LLNFNTQTKLPLDAAAQSETVLSACQVACLFVYHIIKFDGGNRAAIASTAATIV